ncbi:MULTISPECIES: hypothetical protein [unclassified Mesorhizobium]|uniref:hypothetical protein n=1 Tax=unclassified Mesorhizobium TaxID=325217 RepID=UPI00095EBA1B|nr:MULTISPECIES: hypothetical protein [unclassified Mesorhizobium]OJX74200.1 MAG: hypothetical protein BGO93_16725 [Mesorhizobium sp. 65-26]
MAVTGFEFFERDLAVATAGLSPEMVNRAVADFARQEVRRVIAEGIASAKYDRYVNGVAGAPEEAYRAPGAIVYEFLNWTLVINAALDELRRRSPRRSGRYQDSFIVVADQHVVTDFGSIPAGAEVVVLNAQPYTRKMETGGNGRSGLAHVELSGRAIKRRFSGAFTVKSLFLTVASSIDPRVPYILKGQYARQRAAWLANRAAFGKPKFSRDKRRDAGQPITYPALVINAA